MIGLLAIGHTVDHNNEIILVVVFEFCPDYY